MKRLCLFAIFAVLPFAAHATPAAAERAKMAYQLGVERWMLESKLATTPEDREAAAAKRPDPVAAARDVWQAISPELDQAWTLPYAGWFLEMTDGLGVTTGMASPEIAELAKPQQLAIEAIGKFHLQAEKLEPVCMALAGRGTPQRLSLLEKIRKEHPTDTTRGVASLAESLALKTLGDDPGVLARRIQALREAIILSADVKLRGETTVGDIAKEEIYIINNLTKGRTAPDFSGRDTAGRPIKLSDHAGKVVILMFWSAADGNAREFIEFSAAMHARLRGKPIEILGVNLDATAVLRPLEADGTVTWRNISDPQGELSRQYRIGYTPVCFVLDRKRAIQHIGSPGAFVELTATALIEPAGE